MAKTPDELLRPEAKVDDIARLARFYRSGKVEIQSVLNSIEVEKLVRARVQSEVNRVVNDLEAGTKQWIEESYPRLYEDAADSVLEMVNDASKKNVPTNFTPTAADQQTIERLSTSSFNLFREALSGTRRQTSNVLDAVTQERILFELSKQTEKAVTLAQLKETTSQIIKDSGVGALTDRAGRTWQLDTYAEMVARTEHTNIVNTATKAQSLKYGVDLVQFTSHGASDSCGSLEGEIVSLTGQTPGFQKLENAIAGTHMLGPNCRHTYTPISEKEARELAS